MADNFTLPDNTGVTKKAATDEVSYSGDTADVQLMRPVLTTGAEGSKTVVGLTGDATNGLDVDVTRLGDGTSSASVFPAGFLRVTDEPRQIFYDPFDTNLDVVNQWASPTADNLGVLASVVAGVMSMGTGTTAGGWSKLTSIISFKPTIPSWVGFSVAIAIPDLASPTANAYRFWGSGTITGVPTTTAPLTDAIGFELTTAGKLIAVVYAGGTRTAVADLSSATGTGTQPTDASYHRYIVYVRTDRIFWYIDSLAGTSLVATSNFQSPQVQTLPLSLLAVGSSGTPPVTNAQIQSAGVAVWDAGKNATQISDGTFPHRKLNINASGAAMVQLAASSLTADGRLRVSSDEFASWGAGSYNMPDTYPNLPGSW
jgi:hypothetical protein